MELIDGKLKSRTEISKDASAGDLSIVYSQLELLRIEILKGIAKISKVKYEQT